VGKALRNVFYRVRGIRQACALPFEVQPLARRLATTNSSEEDAAHFLIRMVRQYPHQVTIYAGGPL